MALRILLALMGGLLALASRTRASVRQAITRDLVVEIASDDGVAHHYVFPYRRVWRRPAKATRGCPPPPGARGGSPDASRPPGPRPWAAPAAAGGVSGGRGRPPPARGRAAASRIRGGTARAPHRCARSRASTLARRRTASPYTPTSRPPGARPTRGSRTSLSGGTRPSGRRSTG